MRNWFTLLLLTIIHSLTTAQTNTAVPFTLEEAIGYAYENSLVIKNANLNVQDAEQQILERRAIGLPQVNGELNYQYFPRVPIIALPDAFVDGARDPMTGELPPDFSREVSFQLRNNFTAGISANSLIYDGTYGVALKAAKIYREYAQKELENEKRTVKDNVVAAYLPALSIDLSLQLIDQNKANLEELFRETKALYNEGFVEQLDVDRLELSISNLETDRETLARQRETAINALKFIMGYTDDQPIVLVDNIESLIAKGKADTNLTFNLQNRSDYRLVESGIKLSELNIEQYKKGYLPSVAAFANYQYNFQGDQFSTGFWAETFVIGAQVNVPIFDGFDKRSKIQRAKIALLDTQNKQQLLAQTINLEVKNATIEYENASKRAIKQQKNLELAQRIYDTTKVKYKEGVGSSIELSQAEQALFQSQNNYNQALFDTITAKLTLDQALGK